MIRVAFLIAACLLPPCVAEAADPQTEYLVGPSDVLSIAVWRHPDLSGTFTVAADGALTVPLLGAISVSGQTARQVEAAVARQLAAGFVRDPQVTVSVQTYRSQRVYVIGEVRQPGTLTLSGSLTVLEALARAGSVTESAARIAVIARPAAANAAGRDSAASVASEFISVDIGRLQSGELENNVVLRDGDTLVVPRAAPVHVMGEVRRPGDYSILAATTVVEVLSRAGGATERGSIERVRIMRLINGKRKQLDASLEDTLQPGDIVIVRERLF